MNSLLLISLSVLLSLAAAKIDSLSGFGSHPLLFRMKGSCEDGEECPGNPCDAKKCRLPNCQCSGTAIPGGLQASDTPQMIVLTFQNGIRAADMQNYLNLFGNSINPNLCPITGTFYVNHEYTDYFSVQTLWSKRHEIGVNGVTAGDSQDWWKTASEDDWKDQMRGEQEIITTMTDIPQKDITGERAPFLQTGGNNQISAIKKSQLSYDASRVSLNFSQAPNLLWPYTYDYDSIQDCVNPPCANKSYKGVWQIPILAFKDNVGNYCVTMDQCSSSPTPNVFGVLFSAFFGRYTSNKAPMVINLSAAFLQDQRKTSDLTSFIRYVLTFSDVYLVSADRMLEWIKSPTKVSALANFQPWQCKQAPPYVCPQAQAISCLYDAGRKLVPVEGPSVKYRTTACLKKCPKCYPWLNDTQGTKC